MVSEQCLATGYNSRGQENKGSMHFVKVPCKHQAEVPQGSRCNEIAFIKGKQECMLDKSVELKGSEQLEICCQLNHERQEVKVYFKAEEYVYAGY